MDDNDLFNIENDFENDLILSTNQIERPDFPDYYYFGKDPDYIYPIEQNKQWLIERGVVPENNKSGEPTIWRYPKGTKIGKTKDGKYFAVIDNRAFPLLQSDSFSEIDEFDKQRREYESNITTPKKQNPEIKQEEEEEISDATDDVPLMDIGDVNQKMENENWERKNKINQNLKNTEFFNFKHLFTVPANGASDVVGLASDFVIDNVLPSSLQKPTKEYILPSLSPSKWINTLATGKMPWDKDNNGVFGNGDFRFLNTLLDYKLLKLVGTKYGRASIRKGVDNFFKYQTPGAWEKGLYKSPLSQSTSLKGATGDTILTALMLTQPVLEILEGNENIENVTTAGLSALPIVGTAIGETKTGLKVIQNLGEIASFIRNEWEALTGSKRAGLGTQFHIRDIVDKEGNINVENFKNYLDYIVHNYVYKRKFLLGKKQVLYKNNPKGSLDKMTPTYDYLHKLVVNRIQHMLDVAKTAKSLPIPTGNSRQQFVFAALMHDIGDILNRDKHAQLGAELLYKTFPKLRKHNSKFANNILRAVSEHMNASLKLMLEKHSSGDNLVRAVIMSDALRGVEGARLAGSEVPQLVYRQKELGHLPKALKKEIPLREEIENYINPILEMEGSDPIPLDATFEEAKLAIQEHIKKSRTFARGLYNYDYEKYGDKGAFFGLNNDLSARGIGNRRMWTTKGGTGMYSYALGPERYRLNPENYAPTYVLSDIKTLLQYTGRHTGKYGDYAAVATYPEIPFKNGMTLRLYLFINSPEFMNSRGLQYNGISTLGDWTGRVRPLILIKGANNLKEIAIDKNTIPGQIYTFWTTEEEANKIQNFGKLLYKIRKLKHDINDFPDKSEKRINEIRNLLDKNPELVKLCKQVIPFNKYEKNIGETINDLDVIDLLMSKDFSIKKLGEYIVHHFQKPALTSITWSSIPKLRITDDMWDRLRRTIGYNLLGDTPEGIRGYIINNAKGDTDVGKPVVKIYEAKPVKTPTNTSITTEDLPYHIEPIPVNEEAKKIDLKNIKLSQLGLKYGGILNNK